MLTTSTTVTLQGGEGRGLTEANINIFAETEKYRLSVILARYRVSLVRGPAIVTTTVKAFMY